MKHTANRWIILKERSNTVCMYKSRRGSTPAFFVDLKIENRLLIFLPYISSECAGINMWIKTI